MQRDLGGLSEIPRTISQNMCSSEHLYHLACYQSTCLVLYGTLLLFKSRYRAANLKLGCKVLYGWLCPVSDPPFWEEPGALTSYPDVPLSDQSLDGKDWKKLQGNSVWLRLLGGRNLQVFCGNLGPNHLNRHWKKGLSTPWGLFFWTEKGLLGLFQISPLLGILDGL